VAGKAAEIEFCGLANQTLGVGGDFRTIRTWLNLMARAGMFGPLGGALGRPQDMMLTGTESAGAPTPAMVYEMEETFQRILKETRVREFFDQYGLYTPDPTVVRDGEEITILTPEEQQKIAASRKTADKQPIGAD
jgi:hypothetical protein